MTSPLCTVNSGASINGVNVGAGTTVTIALADPGGVSQWSLSCIGTDENNVALTVTAGLSINQVNKTATFTAPSSACALIFQSQVNNGRDVNGNVVAAYTTTFAVFVLLPSGARLAAVNETTEGDATFGWTSKVNAFARAATSGGVPALNPNVSQFAATANTGSLTATSPATLYSYTVPAQSMVDVEFHVFAIRTDATNQDNAVGQIRRAVWRRIGTGAATQVGTTDIIGVDKSDAGVSLTSTINTDGVNAIQLQVNTSAGQTLRVAAHMFVRQVTR